MNLIELDFLLTDSAGEFFRQRRAASSLTQTELAEALDVSQSTISRLERSPAACKLSTVIRAMQLIGISWDDIIAQTNMDEARRRMQTA